MINLKKTRLHKNKAGEIIITRILHGLLVALVLVPVFFTMFGNCRGRKQALTDQKKKFNEFVKSMPDLKVLPAGEKYLYKLRVNYIVDPDLPALDISQVEELFRRTTEYTRRLLGYRVEFILTGTEDIYRFFERKKSDLEDPVFSYPARAWYLDPEAKDLRERVKNVVNSALKKMNKKDPAIALQYFGEAPAGTGQADFVTDVFFKRMRGVLSGTDLRGRPLSAHKRKHHFSFAHWDSLIWQEKEVDFYLVNSMMAGPDTGMPFYVINRGGITSGFVENNPHRPYQAAGVMMLHQFLGQSDYLKKVRGERTLDQTLTSIAVMWVHELGHFLARKEENYTLDGSVHRAPIALDYWSWAQNVLANHKKVTGRIGTLKKF